MHINIIARTNGVGLDQDVDLIHAALTAQGMQVTVSHCRARAAWKRWLPSKPKFDANIFLERVFPRWFGTAKYNLLIPNQERFPKRHIPNLKRIDHVLCKSRHAEEIFAPLSSTRFIGFSSQDRLDRSACMDYQSYFHLAGRSTLKGTEILLDVWAKHPEWPTLTVIQCADNAPQSTASNVQLITEYVTNDTLKKHLNSHGVHLCPSLSEGWGHYIVEAMSTKAVVLTTDAPPMNELITQGRGVLVPYHRTEPRHLGTNYFVDPDKLEKQLTALIHAPSDTKQKLGVAARSWFESNQQKFSTNLPRTVRELIS